MRVGIIGLQHESNTFLKQRTTIENFRRGHLLVGQQVRGAYQTAHHEIGGFLAGLEETNIEAVPLFAAWALPSGLIAPETFEELSDRLLSSLPDDLDGLLVAPHGAAVSELHRDMDGEWLSRLRSRVGPKMPIIGTLDPHANVSRRMVAACQALIAYRTNPHLDQRQRGLEAARLMARTLRGEVTPVLSCALPPLAINIERQLTSASPCRELYALADQMLQQPGILSNSVILGFPYADVEELGSGFLLVTDGDPQLGQSLANELAEYAWRHRGDFVGCLVPVQEAIARTAASRGPVGLLDMGDNVGGGSPADGTILLHAAVEAGLSLTFACLADPGSVQRAVDAGMGNKVRLKLGGKSDKEHGQPLEATVTVQSLHDGKFEETEPRHGGQNAYDMGKTAIVKLPTGQTVMLTALRMAPFSLRQLTSCGVDPAAFQAIIIKGVHAPAAAYAPVCSELIRVDTPGVTRADMTQLEYKHRRRPLFPFEEFHDPD